MLRNNVVRGDSACRAVINPALLALVAWIVGCGPGSGPSLVNVNGTLSHQGQPLSGVLVQFIPEGGGRASQGVTDADGGFTLQYTADRQGAIPGQHRVVVMRLDDETVLPGTLNLEQYGDLETTPLLLEVDGNTALDIDLD